MNNLKIEIYVPTTRYDEMAKEHHTNTCGLILQNDSTYFDLVNLRLSNIEVKIDPRELIQALEALIKGKL